MAGPGDSFHVARPHRTPSPRRLNPLPLMIGAFLPLWSFAFVAGKIGVTDCPPLLLLSGRFLAGGFLILGMVRGAAWMLVAVLARHRRVCDLGPRQQRALSWPQLHGASNGLRQASAALIISANPVLTALLAAVVLGETLTLAEGRRSFSRRGRRCLYRLAIVFRPGTDSLRGILFTLAALASMVAGTILFKRFAPKGNLWAGNGIQNLAGGIMLMPVALSVSSLGDIVPSARLHRRLRLSRALRIDTDISSMVSSSDSVRSDCGEFLPLSNASARDALCMAGSRGACRAPRSSRHSSGRPGHLSGDTADHEDEAGCRPALINAPWRKGRASGRRAALAASSRKLASMPFCASVTR